jgi:hypothetical protein
MTARTYTQHERNLLVSAFLDMDATQLAHGADVVLAQPSADRADGIEDLLAGTYGQLRNPDGGDGQLYVQAIASACDSALHAAVVVCSDVDPLAGVDEEG